SQIVLSLRQRSGRLAQFRSGFAQPYEGHLIRSRLVIEVHLRVYPLRAKLLGAFEDDPKVLRLYGRALDRGLRLADLCLMLREVAFQSRNLISKGSDNVAHVVELSAGKIHGCLESAGVNFE